MIDAVQFDEILSKLTPQMRQEILAAMPPGASDQVAAAQGDMLMLGVLAGQKLTMAHRLSVPEWVRWSAFDTLIAWTTGTGRTCKHKPDYRKPAPVFSAAWRPKLVTCLKCVHLLEVKGFKSTLCDHCGRACRGVKVDDPIYTDTVMLGALAFQFGCCTDCRPDITEATA